MAGAPDWLREERAECSAGCSVARGSWRHDSSHQESVNGEFLHGRGQRQTRGEELVRGGAQGHVPSVSAEEAGTKERGSSLREPRGSGFGKKQPKRPVLSLPAGGLRAGGCLAAPPPC